VARLRGIRAGSASGAPGRASHNPSVVSSSFTRPTVLIQCKSSKQDRCQGWRGLPTGTELEHLTGSPALIHLADQRRHLGGRDQVCLGQRVVVVLAHLFSLCWRGPPGAW
jgi:hypothetical protein